MGILNECVEGGEEGNWTFMRERTCSVIDYIVLSEAVKERVDRMEILERVDSDHLSVVVWIKGGGSENFRGRSERGDRVSRGVWTKRVIELLRKKLRGWGGEDKGVEDWEMLRGKVRECIEETKKTRCKRSTNG